MSLLMTRFDDLPKEIIVDIFSLLPVSQLLATEPVSHKWRDCVTMTLDRVEIFAFDKPDLYKFSSHRCRHFVKQVDLTRTFVFRRKSPSGLFQRISSDQVDSVLPLLNRCPNIECLSLNADQTIEFPDIETLKKLLEALPQLKCVYFGDFRIGTLDQQFNKWIAIQMLVAASADLEFINLTMSKRNQNYYVSLLNLSTNLSIDFTAYSNYEVDAAAVISHANNLSILFPWLRSVARHRTTFGRLNRLRVDYLTIDCPDLNLSFPALEHLTVHFNTNLCPETMINQLPVYNLANLKSLSIISPNNGDILKALADQMISLEKLTLKSYLSQLPGEALFCLDQLVNLTISNYIRMPSDLPQAICLFETVTKMERLTRCKINFHFCHLKKTPDSLIEQFNQVVAHLRQARPFVEIKLHGWTRHH